MVFGFNKKKTKDDSKKKSKKKPFEPPGGDLTNQTTEKILEKEQVAELLILEDMVDKQAADHTVYTKICAFYMVITPLSF